MRPLFTIHAGEYLVGEFIEKNFRGSRVWVPTKDSGIDLLVTDNNCKRSVSIQVKFSKDYFGSSVKPEIAKGITSGGWWTFDKSKLKNSKADYWVLVLYQFQNRNNDFIVIKPMDLYKRYQELGRRKNIISSYFWVTKSNLCWETRSLDSEEQIQISKNKYENKTRNFTKYLNNWTSIKHLTSL